MARSRNARGCERKQFIVNYCSMHTRSRFVGATGVNCIQHRVSIECISLALHVEEVIIKKKTRRDNLSTPQNSYFTLLRLTGKISRAIVKILYRWLNHFVLVYGR